MTSGSDDIFRRTRNPFPSSPVVQLHVLAPGGLAGAMPSDLPVSIRTRAHRTLMSQVTEYLERAEEATTRGRALALIGSLGLGKSHLAREVVGQVREVDTGIPVWVISQPSRDMGEAYRSQLTALYEDAGARNAFEIVVEAFHAHVTAAALEDDSRGLDSPTQQEFVRQLRDDQLDSRKVVQGLGIDEELIHRHLRTQLREVTGHRQFATALALLLDPRFNYEVWQWLKGGDPADILVERGIARRIDGALGVLDAFAVFGFLHGQVGRPYVLIVDALEVVLRWPQEHREDFLNGFESLVNTFVNRGGLLVMCTQPEPWSELPPGLHERVFQIWPDRLDRGQTEKLVDEYVRRQCPGTALFTADALEQLTEIDNGIPRQILKTCRQAWQLMELPGENRPAVDGPVVHEAVRALSERRPMLSVYEAVERALTEEQWPREGRPTEVARLADPDLDRVNYWVRVGEHDAIAILVVSSVLLTSEVLEIDAVSRAANAAFDGCRTLVLVNGSISRAMRNQLAQATGTAPLLVGDPDFRALLGRTITLLANRLLATHQRGGIDDVSGRLTTMSAEQSAVLESLRRLEIALERGVDERSAAPGEAAEPALPSGVHAHFTAAQAALDALDALFELPTDVRRVFAVDGSGRPLAGERPKRLTFGSQQLEALGLLSAVDRLLRAFRAGVTDWWRAAAQQPGGPGPELRGGLSTLCRSFEISMEILPALEPVGVTSGTAVAVRRAKARDLLDRLAESVLTDLAGATGNVADGEVPPTGR